MQYLKRKITKNIYLVYGFTNNKPRYSLIATLNTKVRSTYIYGLLSREALTLKDFIKLWKFLQGIVKTKYIIFEAINSDAKVYSVFLKPVKCISIKTFNGHQAKELKCLTNSVISIGNK